MILTGIMYCIYLIKTLIFVAEIKIVMEQVETGRENTQSQMKKGLLELCILAILSGGEAYPTEMMEKLKGAKMVVVEGTLYPLLTRLKNAGFLTYRWEESNAGPPRKYYNLSEEGRKLLGNLFRSWKEISSAVHSLTEKI